MQNETDYYLTRQQVAERLGISYDTLVRWVNERKFPEISLGHKTIKRYHWPAVQAWMKSQQGGEDGGMV